MSDIRNYWLLTTEERAEIIAAAKATRLVRVHGEGRWQIIDDEGVYDEGLLRVDVTREVLLNAHVINHLIRPGPAWREALGITAASGIAYTRDPEAWVEWAWTDGPYVEEPRP